VQEFMHDNQFAKRGVFHEQIAAEADAPDVEQDAHFVVMRRT
jgi:hypothetical protein